MRRYVFLGIGLSCSLAVACQLVLGVESVDKVPAPLGEGGDAPPSAAEAGPPDPCAHVRPPNPPAADDDLNTQVPPFYLAFRKMEFDPNAAGLDLDGVCTCNKEPYTAYDGSASCVGRAPQCDIDGGVDNQVGVAFANGATEVIDIGGLTGTFASGDRNVLLHVAGWNGRPNDKDVTFGILSSSGINDPSGCSDAGTTDAGLHYPPQWCGKDKWDYLPNSTISVSTGITPSLRGPAYVTGNRIVYESATSFSFFLGDATISFGSAIITGALDKNEDGHWRLTGMLTGRIPINELLAAFGQLPVDDGDGGVTQGCHASDFPIIRATLCAALDIAHTKTLDFTGAPCDAVSLSLNFVAEEATVGIVDPSPPKPAQCDPSRVSDPTLYACPE